MFNEYRFGQFGDNAKQGDQKPREYVHSYSEKKVYKIVWDYYKEEEFNWSLCKGILQKVFVMKGETMVPWEPDFRTEDEMKRNCAANTKTKDLTKAFVGQVYSNLNNTMTKCKTYSFCGIEYHFQCHFEMTVSG